MFPRINPRTLLSLSVALLNAGCIVILRDSSPEHQRLETDVEIARRAMAEVRVISTAFESFAVDSNRYPGGDRDSPETTVGDFQLHRVSVLSGELKAYARSLPRVDPWESPYLFWSDGQRYVVLCLGADGVVTHRPRLLRLLESIAAGQEAEPTRSSCLEDEIVFGNGAAISWPSDPIRRCDRHAKDQAGPPNPRVNLPVRPAGYPHRLGGHRRGERQQSWKSSLDRSSISRPRRTTS